MNDPYAINIGLWSAAYARFLGQGVLASLMREGCFNEGGHTTYLEGTVTDGRQK